MADLAIAGRTRWNVELFRLARAALRSSASGRR
jgi:hypothetical protein